MSKNFGEILLARREFLQSVVGLLGAGCTNQRAEVPTASIVQHTTQQKSSTFDFQNLPPILDETIHVAEGYRADILVKWGDPLFPNVDDFDFARLTGEDQARRFGYNNDFLALLEHEGHWLLTVNHESTSAQLMFEGEDQYTSKNIAHTPIEMAAHGLSIVELNYSEGRWNVLRNSPFNRRITADTPMKISGLCAGSSRMQTPEDPTGREALGTLHNCSGGMTPWGTILTCEENILYYFGGSKVDEQEAKNYARYNIGYKKLYQWYQSHPRFDLTHAPKQPNRFGWVVEIDPTDPNSTPIKRTSLGRFYHESANPIQNTDGRMVIYMGDDGYFEYLYRFVSEKPYVPSAELSRLEQGNVLDDGDLSVAQFHEDGTLVWIPLVQGERGLTPENGFHTQEDVLIEARRAGDIVGATPMDRCEDVEPNAFTNKVYINCTLNPKRGTKEFPSAGAGNPRNQNRAGHTIELTPPDGNHAADVMVWEMLLLAGDVQDGADYGVSSTKDTQFACPDNAAIDPTGRLWITTDGSEEVLGIADAIYAIETEGPQRGQPRRLFSGPIGAEITGPCFSPDGRSLFLSVQHPGFGPEKQRMAWPDFSQDMPARPSVVVIQRIDGGVIGG